MSVPRPQSEDAVATIPQKSPVLQLASSGAATSWIYVCRQDAIVPNTGVCAKVGAHQVAVFRLVAPADGEETILAIDNFDPRSEANVLSRGIVGDIGGVEVVASPVYKNHYCLKTGRCLEDEQYRVRTWPVRIADGQVYVRGAPA